MPLPADYIGTNKIVTRRGRRIQTAQIARQTWTDPIALDADGYSLSHAGAAAAGTTSMTLGGALASGGVGRSAHARNVVITVTHGSAVVAMSGVITGTDINGRVQTEAWSVTAGGTSKTFTGAKGFKTITSITEVIAADASTNTIVAGTGKVFGLSAKMSLASPLKEVASGVVVTTGTVVAASTAATADPRGTYSPSANPDGSADFVLYWLSDDPEQSD